MPRGKFSYDDDYDDGERRNAALFCLRFARCLVPACMGGDGRKARKGAVRLGSIHEQ